MSDNDERSIEGERVAEISIIFETLSRILRGEMFGLRRTDAPADLRVLRVVNFDDRRILVYVWSETYEPVQPGQPIPNVQYEYWPERREAEPPGEFAGTTTHV